MWHLSSTQQRTYPDQQALKVLQQAAPAFGLAARDVTTAYARNARAVGLIGEDYVLHLVPRNPAWQIDLPADLDREGKVLDYLNTALPAGAIAVPKVFRTLELPEGTAQLRSFIQGETYETLEKCKEINIVSFARSLGHAVADLHNVRVDPLRAFMSRNNSRHVLESEQLITLGRQQMDDYLWVGANDVRQRFNEISQQRPVNDVLLHNDLLPRNFRLNGKDSRLTGVYDFGHAYLGHYACEFGELANVYQRPEIICETYTERSGRRISPTVIAAESVKQFFFDCCRMGQHVPAPMQDELADKLDHYQQMVRRYGPLERAFA